MKNEKRIRKLKKLRKSKMVGAYFTVEATFVMPIVIAVMVLVIFMMFYQYDRCLMEQNMGRLSVKAAAIRTSDSQQWLEAMKKYASEIEEDCYLVWESGEVTLEKGQGKVKVAQTGALKFPFAGWQIAGVDSKWETTVIYESRVRNPVSIIRKLLKVKNGLNTDETGEEHNGKAKYSKE